MDWGGWWSMHTGAEVVIFTAVVGHELHRGVRRDVFGVLGDEFYKGEGA